MPADHLPVGYANRIVTSLSRLLGKSGFEGDVAKIDPGECLHPHIVMDLPVSRQAGLQPDVHVVRTDASFPELHTAFPAEKAQVAHTDLPGAVRGGEHQQHRHIQQRSLPGVELDGEGRFGIDGQHVVPAAHQIPLRHGHRETRIEGQVRQRIPPGLLPDAREEIRPAARRRIRHSILHP